MYADIIGHWRDVQQNDELNIWVWAYHFPENMVHRGGSRHGWMRRISSDNETICNRLSSRRDGRCSPNWWAVLPGLLIDKMGRSTRPPLYQLPEPSPSCLEHKDAFPNCRIPIKNRKHVQDKNTSTLNGKPDFSSHHLSTCWDANSVSLKARTITASQDTIKNTFSSSKIMDFLIRNFGTYIPSTASTSLTPSPHAHAILQ